MERIKNKIGVIIATSLNRNQLLFKRAIKSVLEQTYKPDYLLIVDDNLDEKISTEIVKELEKIKKNETFTKIIYTKNQHTKGMSGTGAWNTGFDFYKTILKETDYVAILDDDDSWETDYLEKAADCIKNETPDQIIGFIKRSDCFKPNIFGHKELCDKKFLEGNPGIQGSNLFFKFSVVIKSGGFDETLASCTDRDFMLKVLHTNKNHKAVFLNKVLINHFVEPDSVTKNPVKKNAGLNAFYKKYIADYSWKILNKSLLRAEKFFNFPDADNIRKLWKLYHKKAAAKKIVIGVAVHNSQKTVRKTIESILKQKNVKEEVWILICDDDSSDDWKNEIKDYLNKKRIIYWKVDFYNVSKVRNFISDFTKVYFGNVSLIGRLDSDDEYASEKVLSQIEKIKDETDADFIIAGNYLKKDDHILEKVNIPTPELLNHDCLLNRLKEMAEGTAENELPSCNVFMTPEHLRYYPDVKSAEDHYLTAKILWNKEKFSIVLAGNIILTIYSLDGSVTNKNKAENNYACARKALYKEMLNYGKQ